MLVSADSARLKMAAFSVRWERLVSADPKGVMGAICSQEGKYLGTADSEGVRRTAWRARMVRKARSNRADLATIITYWYLMSMITCKWFACCGIAGCLVKLAPGKRPNAPQFQKERCAGGRWKRRSGEQTREGGDRRHQRRNCTALEW